jgi:hypothetical protein
LVNGIRMHVDTTDFANVVILVESWNAGGDEPARRLMSALVAGGVDVSRVSFNGNTAQADLPMGKSIKIISSPNSDSIRGMAPTQIWLDDELPEVIDVSSAAQLGRVTGSEGWPRRVGFDG